MSEEEDDGEHEKNIYIMIESKWNRHKVNSNLLNYLHIFELWISKHKVFFRRKV